MNTTNKAAIRQGILDARAEREDKRLAARAECTRWFDQIEAPIGLRLQEMRRHTLIEDRMAASVAKLDAMLFDLDCQA